LVDYGPGAGELTELESASMRSTLKRAFSFLEAQFVPPGIEVAEVRSGGHIGFRLEEGFSKATRVFVQITNELSIWSEIPVPSVFHTIGISVLFKRTSIQKK
jgi:hypothetical protein